MSCDAHCARGPAALTEEQSMRRFLVAGIISAALIAISTEALAGERTLTGAAIGAGAGAIVAGPIGAVAGGAVGAWVGGPRFTRRYRECWYDRGGYRHCRWR
jgi:hypothetical protein